MEQQKKTTDKLTDKAFSRLVLTSILGILVCIVCLCSSTYAWFTESHESPKNEIKTAGECLISVTVLHNGTAQDTTPIENIEDGVELAAGDYLVTLTLPSGSASGYYLVEASGATYYTDYIARHEEAEPKTVSFIMTVEGTQTVKFTSCWGIYAQESDVVEGILLIPTPQTNNG